MFRTLRSTKQGKILFQYEEHLESLKEMDTLFLQYLEHDETLESRNNFFSMLRTLRNSEKR